MLIKKYKHHHKNISNNIHIQQCSSSAAVTDELTPALTAATTVAEASCHCTANKLRHFFLKLYMSWYNSDKHHHLRMRTRPTHTPMWCSSSSVLVVVLGVILLPLPPLCNAVGYSYTRFTGPVSGPEHRVYLPNAVTGHRGGGIHASDDAHDEAARVDYVAKPEYEFAYGVEDAQAHILHNRNEMRDGDAVKGVYSVVDPDGTLRIVKYTADDINGFQAEVIRNGISAIHGQLQQDTPTIITPQNNHNSYSNDGHNDYHQLPEDYSNYNHGYQPSYYYQTPAHHENPTDSSTYPSSNNDNNNAYGNHNDDYNDYQDYNNNVGDYRPQYEVHERPNKDEEHVNEDGGKEDNNKAGNGGKKKDYDDDDDDGDDDDDYDYSEELVDYDEAVKNQEGSKESDEYY